MLDKLGSFYSYTITKIQIFINDNYAFYRLPNILDYVAKLLKKDKFFYNNMKNISNKKRHHIIEVLFID